MQVHRATLFEINQLGYEVIVTVLNPLDIKLVTTTSPTTIASTPKSTQAPQTRSTTLRLTTRKQMYTSSTPITTQLTDSSNENEDLEMEFVTDFPGSNSLFYPGVESYQHHINYINSQVSFHEKFHLHWLSVSVYFLRKTS